MYYAGFPAGISDDADRVVGGPLIAHLRSMSANADRLQKWCQQLDKQAFEQNKLIVELYNRIAVLEKKMPRQQ